MKEHSENLKLACDLAGIQIATIKVKQAIRKRMEVIDRTGWSAELTQKHHKILLELTRMELFLMHEINDAIYGENI